MSGSELNKLESRVSFLEQLLSTLIDKAEWGSDTDWNLDKHIEQLIKDSKES